jgi:acetyl esterase/lipase
MKKIFIVIFILAALAAASIWFVSDRDRGLWVLTTALKIANPISSNTDIAYGDSAWQRLDVYPQKTASPVVIFIHGGSWRHGRKDQYRFAADAFHRLGYTVVLPDYIKYPNKEANYPSFAIDAAKAVAWVKANIDDYNGDSNNVFLAGHSAGAHTALMVATDSQFLSAEGLSESDLRGVAGIAGPYSFIPDWKVTKAVFGPPENYPLMDALNYVDGKEPSTILLHSQGDTQVGQYNQDKLGAKLKAMNVDVETVLYTGIGHIDMVTHLHPWFKKQSDVAGDIDRFFRARIK